MISVAHQMAGLLLVCSVIAARDAGAATVRHFFTGVVVKVPAVSEFESRFGSNQAVFGQYTFEPTTADVLDSSSQRASYPGAVSSFEMTIGDFSVSLLDVGDIKIDNDFANRDQYSVLGLSIGADVGSFFSTKMEILLQDEAQVALTADSLSEVPPEISTFSSPRWTLDFDHPTSPGAWRLEGTVTSIHVPEPPALRLVTCGFLISICILAFRNNRTVRNSND